MRGRALLGLGLAPARPVKDTLAGGAAGLALGVGLHLFWHFSGRSPAPAEGILGHVLAEATVGSLVGVLVAAASWLFLQRS